MSFFSDKDFKKGAGPKKVVGGGGKAKVDELKNADNVVEKARIQREERAKNRETSVFIVKIQSWLRGKSIAIKTIAEFRRIFDTKLTDIENLSKLLLNKNNIVFIPPVSISLDLAKKLTAFGFNGVQVHGLYVCRPYTIIIRFVKWI
jgi:hypothetical protein